jgi:hypothetical protein
MDPAAARVPKLLQSQIARFETLTRQISPRGKKSLRYQRIYLELKDTLILRIWLLQTVSINCISAIRPNSNDLSDKLRYRLGDPRRGQVSFAT